MEFQSHLHTVLKFFFLPTPFTRTINSLKVNFQAMKQQRYIHVSLQKKVQYWLTTYITSVYCIFLML